MWRTDNEGSVNYMEDNGGGVKLTRTTRTIKGGKGVTLARAYIFISIFVSQEWFQGLRTMLGGRKGHGAQKGER